MRRDSGHHHDKQDESCATASHALEKLSQMSTEFATQREEFLSREKMMEQLGTWHFEVLRHLLEIREVIAAFLEQQEARMFVSATQENSDRMWNLCHAKVSDSLPAKEGKTKGPNSKQSKVRRRRSTRARRPPRRFSKYLCS